MVKGRFAPSPSGRMHLGNIYTALISWLSVRKQNGTWLLRIEDLDRQRCKAEYTKVLMDDLQWLGLDWDEGPRSVDDVQYFQSKRDNLYLNAFEQLCEKNLVYDCFCSRADLLASSAPQTPGDFQIYSGKCRSLTAQEKLQLSQTRQPAQRIALPNSQLSFVDGHYGKQSVNLQKECGDFIVRRADKNFSYQLAVVVDDALMGVTEVVRGRDLLSSTAQQLFLYKSLGFNAPHFCHVPLLITQEGRRLSKRDHDISMEVLRTQYSPEEVIGTIMFLCGCIPKRDSLSLSEAISVFNWSSIPLNDIILNP